MRQRENGEGIAYPQYNQSTQAMSPRTTSPLASDDNSSPSMINPQSKFNYYN